MKKLFTIDDFMIAMISVLGYGYGEAISRLSGWPMPVCMGVSLVAGISLEAIMHKIAFSEAVQRKPIKRVITYVVCFLIFLAAHSISVVWLGISMIDYLLGQYIWILGMTVISFAVNLLIRKYRVRRIQKHYGDGSKGYVFDVKNEDIEGINRKNQAIHGEYDADLAVKTKTGVYVGMKQKKIISHLGIPYALPPVGERRWKAPEPLPASDAVFEAVNFGASAIQVEQKGSILKLHRQSEDCLYLNICTGAQKTETKKPVLVLLHHGDFTYGGTADPLLYGDEFVRNHPDTVFVSFNYRLGIFGFIDFSEVPGGEDYPDALNLGLLDQIAALKWIKENIAAFGGDPNQITVLGFESGATSICMLAAGKRAQGLFRRAFVFNGNLGTVYDTPANARALAKNLLKETKTATMEELLQLNTEALKDAAQRLWGNMCAPTCDGTWIPTDLARAYQEGAASGIEFIIGIPSKEMQVFRSILDEQNYKTAICAGMAAIQACIDDSVAGAVKAYIETQAAESTELEAKAKLIEQWCALCVYRAAVKLAEGGNEVHVMYWDAKPLIEKLGSGTVDAAAALLGNSDAAQMYGSVMNADLSETLQTLLYKFISGKALRLYPNEIKGMGAIDWEAFPRALIVSDDKLQCDTIEDRLTEIKGLLDVVAE